MSGAYAQPTQVLLAGYAQNGKDAVLVAPSSKQLALISVRAMNRSGGAIDVGIVRKFAQGFKLFSYVAAGSVYTNLTLTATNTIFTTTANGGFVVQSKSKSGLMGFTVLQGESVSPVYSYQYWNGAGWVTLTVIAKPTTYATGSNLIVFLPPSDWAVGGDTGLDQDKYSIRVRSTTAGGQVVTVTAVWCGQLIDFIEAVADNNSLNIEFDRDHPLILDGGEGLMPYFSGTASADNALRTAYTTV